MKTLRLLLTLYLGLPIAVSAALELPALSDFTKAFDPQNKNPDTTELAYFGNRSAILLHLIGAHFSQNGSSQEDKSSGARITEIANIYEHTAYLIDSKLNGRDATLIDKQKRLFMEYYMARIEESRLKNNTLFDPEIKRDFDLAMKHAEYFETLYNGLKIK